MARPQGVPGRYHPPSGQQPALQHFDTQQLSGTTHQIQMPCCSRACRCRRHLLLVGGAPATPWRPRHVREACPPRAGFDAPGAPACTGQLRARAHTPHPKKGTSGPVGLLAMIMPQRLTTQPFQEVCAGPTQHCICALCRHMSAEAKDGTTCHPARHYSKALLLAVRMQASTRGTASRLRLGLLGGLPT